MLKTELGRGEGEVVGGFEGPSVLFATGGVGRMVAGGGGV